jgi:hypothetical protein
MSKKMMQTHAVHEDQTGMWPMLLGCRWRFNPGIFLMVTTRCQLKAKPCEHHLWNHQTVIDSSLWLFPWNLIGFLSIFLSRCMQHHILILLLDTALSWPVYIGLPCSWIMTMMIRNIWRVVETPTVSNSSKVSCVVEMHSLIVLENECLP